MIWTLKALRRVSPAALIRGVLLGLIFTSLVFVPGCSAGKVHRYRRSFFSVKRYSTVQLLLPGGADREAVPVESLLLLKPIGEVPDAVAESLHLAIWQELQQILPGSVRTPEKNSAYERYIRGSNLLLEDGGVAMDEILQIGRAARASHVLSVRIIGYRPYHPQRLIMEWVLFDIEKKRNVLILSGGLDAAEHEVERAAIDYFKTRRAETFSGEGLDVLLRSPGEYSRFAVVQAVDALRKEICSQHHVVRP